MSVSSRVKGISRRALWRAACVLGALGPGVRIRLQVRALRAAGVVVEGLPRYIDPTAYIDLRDPGLITFRHGCVVSREVMVLTHDHSVARALESIGVVARYDAVRSEPVVVGRGAFIGARAVLLPGTSIGEFAIVGAGAVVKGDVPAGVVIAGNPAKPVGGAADLAQRWTAAHGADAGGDVDREARADSRGDDQ